MDTLEVVLSDESVDFVVELDLTVELGDFVLKSEVVDRRIDIFELGIAELGSVVLPVEFILMEATDVDFRAELTLIRIELPPSFDVTIELVGMTLPKFGAAGRLWRAGLESAPRINILN